jgi:hypothetical protein
MELETQRRFPVALLAAAIVLALLGAGAYWALRQGETTGAGRRLPFGSNEQAYVASIHFDNLKMTRAANYLRQEVTFLSGTVSNDGPRALHNIEVTVEYHDSLDRVVLRERMPLFGARPVPLGPGQKRAFELGFEHIPATWNYVYPTIRVTGLLFD